MRTMRRAGDEGVKEESKPFPARNAEYLRSRSEEEKESNAKGKL